MFSNWMGDNSFWASLILRIARWRHRQQKTTEMLTPWFAAFLSLPSGIGRAKLLGTEITLFSSFSSFFPIFRPFRPFSPIYAFLVFFRDFSLPYLRYGYLRNVYLVWQIVTNFCDDGTNFCDEFLWRIFVTNFCDEFFWRVFLTSFFDEFFFDDFYWPIIF